MKNIKVIIPKACEPLEGLEQEPLDYIIASFAQEDISRIIDLFESKGYFVSRKRASFLWEVHSQDWDANWLDLPKEDDQLWKRMEAYWQVSKKGSN